VSWLGLRLRKGVAALAAALQAKDGDALANLLGPEHRADLTGSDPAQARQWMDQLNVLANQGAKLEPNADGSLTVVMGRQDWPMPVPLVEVGQHWRYDTAAGLERSTTGASAATNSPRSASCAPMSTPSCNMP
jgi:hypothetical protein